MERLRSEFPEVTIIRADVCALPAEINEGTFDVISAFDVLFHVIDDDEYERALRDLGRLLAEDGYLIFSEGCLHAGTRQREAFSKHRSRASIETALANAGLGVLSMRPMFVLMGPPVDAATSRPMQLWEKFMKTIAACRLDGFLATALYPLELLLLKSFPRGPSTKVLVCRSLR